MARSVIGIPELKKAFESLEPKLRNKVLRTELRKAAKVMAAEVKARSPVESGKLKASVKVRSTKRKKGRVAIQVEVTGGHPDAIVGFTEFGRAGQQPNPFIRTSFAEKEPMVKADLLAAIKEGIEKIADESFKPS